MKNIIKLSAFALLFGLSTQLMSAQSTAKEDALGQAKELKTQTGFKTDKFKSVYAAYLKYNRKMESINKHIDPETISYMEAVEKLETKFNTEMKGILSESQFVVFKKNKK